MPNKRKKTTLSKRAYKKQRISNLKGLEDPESCGVMLEELEQDAPCITNQSPAHGIECPDGLPSHTIYSESEMPDVVLQELRPVSPYVQNQSPDPDHNIECPDELRSHTIANELGLSDVEIQELQPVSSCFVNRSLDDNIGSPDDIPSHTIANEPEFSDVAIQEFQPVPSCVINRSPDDNSECPDGSPSHLLFNEPGPSGLVLQQLQPVSPCMEYQSQNRNFECPERSHSNSDDDHSLLVEPECEIEPTNNVSGRRVIDFMFMIKQWQDIADHESLFNCKSSDLTLISEKRIGLISHYNFECQLCRKKFNVKSDDPKNDEYVDINTAAATGIVASGIGFSQFEEIFGAIDIPIFGEKYYAKIQDDIFAKWEATAADVMEQAAAREREAAIQEGRVFNGIPVIDVYADAAWCKRSFGNNYKALSGVAAIVGRRFGEVLFVGVKNKYCLICARAKKREEEPKEHKCYKNYEGASSGMEAAIVSEGFKASINMYGLIYGRLVADGDSSTYAKILESAPYPGLVVEKIECRNHILRNMCTKLRTLAKDTKYPKKQRDLINDHKIFSIRNVITNSVATNKDLPRETGTNELYEDITNSVNHAYGDHRQCKDYYCDKNKVILSATVAENEHSPFWFRMKVIIRTVASKTRSLLEDVDTNSVERFNSIIAKFVGGKRINFASKRSYQSRCSAAVVSYNTRMPIYTLHKKILGKSPRSSIKKMELRRIQRRKLANVVKRKKNRSKFIQKQNDYGSGAAAPDMAEDDFKKASADFIANLKTMVSDRRGVQERTKRQRESPEWLQIRKLMITASNFGAIVKRQKNFGALVNNILYKKNISSVASVAHGIKNEKFALEQLSSQENLKIEECGLFVDEEFPFIGATPDGIVGEDTIVEVKCPVAASKVGIQNAIKQNKVQILKYNKKHNQVTINQNSNWFYQVQGQLRVTGKQRCVFGIWGKETDEMEVIYIQKDDNFWKTKMESKLVSFYQDHILPELVDSRRARGMPLRGSEKQAI